MSVKMKMFWVVLAFIGACVACLLAQPLPPLPPASTRPVLASPRAAGEMVNEPMVREAAAELVPQRVELNWTYRDQSGRALTLPRPGVVFEIYNSADLKTWTLAAIVDAPPYVTTSTASRQFYHHQPKAATSL